LKKAEKERQRAATFSHIREQPQRKVKTTTGTGTLRRKPSEQNILRAHAAANVITAKGGS